MNYRPQWFENVAKGRGVAQIAVDIHSTISGSYERDSQSLYQDVLAVRWVLENWQEPTGAFDNAVHYLLSGAIAEYDAAENNAISSVEPKPHVR